MCRALGPNRYRSTSSVSSSVSSTVSSTVSSASTSSVALNFGEGSSRLGQDRRHHFSIALGSALEVRTNDGEHHVSTNKNQWITSDLATGLKRLRITYPT